MGMRVFLTAPAATRQRAGAPPGRTAEVDSITGVYNSTRRSALAAKVEYVKLDLRSPDMARAMAGHDVCSIRRSSSCGEPECLRAPDDICVNGACNVANAA